MNTIHKYVLAPQTSNEIMLPEDAVIVTAQEQHEEVVIWVQLDPDPDLPRYPRVIRTFYTGVPLPGGLRYIGTAQLHLGRTVVHVFEEL
jgi:hypothetical protein